MAGKSKTKKLQINLTNRWLYTLIVFFSLIVIGVFVYATTPNPGHDITQVAPPAVCSDNQFLQWSGSEWTCAEGGAGTETDPVWTGNSTNVAFTNMGETFDENLAVTKNFTVDTTTLFVNSNTNKVGIGGILDPNIYKLAVGGPLFSSGIINTTQYGIFKKGVILRADEETCSSAFAGMLRYRKFCQASNACDTYFEACMQSNVDQYNWIIIKEFGWASGGDGEGDDGEPSFEPHCSAGQDWYWCLGYYELSGCYNVQPQNCYEFR